MAKNLLLWQKFRNSCKECKIKKGKGDWCTRQNIKCSYLNCKDTPPFISFGNRQSKKSNSIIRSPNVRGGLSKQTLKALELRKKKYSYKRIGDKLNISKTRAYELVKNAEAFIKGYKGVTLTNDKPICKKPNVLGSKKLKRLHNDSVSFLIEPIDLSMVKDRIKLKYSSYVLDKRDKSLHIQIFGGKLVVRFKEDLVSEDLCILKKMAKDRIINFLENYSFRGVDFLGDKYEQVSRHYAIVGNDFAKKIIREKRKFFIKGRGGVDRVGVDFSNKRAEFESFDKDTGYGDTCSMDEYFNSLLDKQGYYDLPDVTKKKLDIILGVQKRYAEQIELHLKVQNETLKTLKAIRKHIKK